MIKRIFLACVIVAITASYLFCGLSFIILLFGFTHPEIVNPEYVPTSVWFGAYVVAFFGVATTAYIGYTSARTCRLK